MKTLKTLICVLTVIGLCGCHGTRQSEQDNTRAKYIFLFIGDGMGHSLVSLTESYMSYKAGKIGGEHLTFSDFPIFGNVSTYSADSPVTCSAAAGTAIASGQKTVNGKLGRSADGTPLRSFAFDLKNEGYKVGVISDAPINHATPAAFYSTPESRNHYYQIIQQIPHSRFDYFAASGFLEFIPADSGEPDCEKLLEDNGYEVVWGRDELDEVSPETEKIVLCNKENKGRNAKNYEADNCINPENFTLAEMVSTGIEFLTDEDPFIIICEGGLIDWSAHINKTMPTIASIIELDKAVKVAYEFYQKHPEETLIVVTSDHDTGGASVGYGDEWVNEQPKWAIMDSVWNAAGQTNKLNAEENEALNAQAHIGWTTAYHTGAEVPVYAIGAGAERFCGRMDNTDFKGKILGE